MEITIPHNYTPRDYQIPLLKAMDSGINRAIVVWHRRAGKDITAWNYCIKRAIQEVGTYYYFLPTYSQAKKIIWDGINQNGERFIDHIPESIRKKVNETDMKIELINGSIIQLVGADNIDRIVGTNPIGVVLSEFSLMKPNVWEYLRPILAENKGWAIFIFTPRGMNHSWELLQKAQENDKWFTEILTVEDTDAISKDALEEEKGGMPEDLFNQEFHCKFIEGAGQFFRNVDQNICVPDEGPDTKRKYQIGIDLAKFQDYTVITVFDLMTFNCCHIERFNQMDYNLQKAKIEAVMRRYGNPTGYIDSTGPGEPVYDDLVERGLNLIPYHFTYQSRMDLLVNLQLLLEQRKIGIPEDSNLISELKSFRYELTPSGKTKVSVPEGLHDDIVFSLALSVWQLPNVPLPQSTSMKFLLNRRDSVTQLRAETYE